MLPVALHPRRTSSGGEAVGDGMVGRIGREQRGLGAVEQPGHVASVGRIAAQQTVLSEDLQVAHPDVRLVRDRRHVVGVDQACPEHIELIFPS